FRVFARVGGIARPAGVDVHVATVGPAQTLQRLLERGDAGLCFRIVRGERHEHADAPHTLELLRTRYERPSSCHAADSAEIAPPHVPPRPGPRKGGSKASTQGSVRHATRCPLWVISGH